MAKDEKEIDLRPLMRAIGERVLIGDAISDGCEIGGDGNQGTLEIVQRWKLKTPEAVDAIERALDLVNLEEGGNDRIRRIRSMFIVMGDQPTSPP